jgi:hypothetical protein
VDFPTEFEASSNGMVADRAETGKEDENEPTTHFAQNQTLPLIALIN